MQHRKRTEIQDSQIKAHIPQGYEESHKAMQYPGLNSTCWSFFWFNVFVMLWPLKFNSFQNKQGKIAFGQSNSPTKKPVKNTSLPQQVFSSLYPTIFSVDLTLQDGISGL